MYPEDLPLLSLIVPCYNEEDVVAYTIPRLIAAFKQKNYPLELVVCNNGSTDSTGAQIQSLVSQGYPLVVNTIHVNEGYGNGILDSARLCTGTLIGSVPADGQVDAEDVVRVYETVARSKGLVIGKVYRRFRLDGPWRSIVTRIFNITMILLWPNIGTMDVNANPKIMHRDVFDAMQLETKGWLLDPEIMIKASYMGIKVIEMNVFARMREHGVSHIRASTVWEFVSTLFRYRFGDELKPWRDSYTKPSCFGRDQRVDDSSQVQ